jgi:hypothetical protein
MSQETNNEIDLLLRRMGRRDHDGARNIAAPVDDRHLDADELSSYAQNALPSAARARYTEHVAECATCRRLVTELILSLGAVTGPVAATHEPRGVRKFLAGLFSPLVLRYAVPALGVMVVMIVGFVVLRQQRQQEFVAQLQDNKTPVPAAAPSPQTTPAEGFIDTRKQETDKLDNSNAKPGKTGPAPQTANGNASGGASGAVPAPITTTDQPIAEAKAEVSATPAAAAPAPAKAADTAAAPSPKTEDVAKKQEEQPKEKAADEEKAPAPPATRGGLATVQPAGRVAQNAPKPEPSANAKVFGAARPLSRSRAGVATAQTEDEKRDDAADRVETKNKDVNNETRTIAGRHFRKQGGIWTDTAYDSSTATVNMARNSEQFRALVADEPAIGTIARQLDGEVIVVWKGRAYHIR